ncbi:MULTISPECIES: DUF5994 family protein [unclassified Kitasatospora]|uniref:DUF5994 family protein n=1 Tax=unclassified Kitasatospora TaxID=2633591 RepID=UPI000714DC32|nr:MULTISPECIES: DUF5994 family protein [unclassified Kitasatospora]KQV22254.1 hypothetical protein ASC99_18105 [Kitasatospora sp. Root107]
MRIVNFPNSAGGWVAPGMPPLPRLMLERTRGRDGLFDGAWWPRSTDLGAELPDLISALAAHPGGRILRVGLDPAGWHHLPIAVDANGLAVRVSWCTSSAGTITLTRATQDQLLLLVVPPGTVAAVAARAMAGAAATSNHTPAAELLAESGV